MLCRTRSQVREISTALKEAGVRVSRRVEGVARGSAAALRSAACNVLSILTLVVNPADDAAFASAMALPSSNGRAGWAGAQSGTKKAFQYLCTVQRILAQSAAARGGVGGGAGSGLLAAAQSAASRGFPQLKSDPRQQSSALLSLTKPQQQDLRTFMGLVLEVRERAVRQAPASLLEWLVSRVGLVDHLEKVREQSESQRRAFTIRVPGEASRRAAGDSIEEEEDDEDDGYGGYGGHGGSGSSSGAGWSASGQYASQASPQVASTIAWLLRTATVVAQGMGHGDGRGEQRTPLAPQEERRRHIETLGRFNDDLHLVMASHDGDAGGSAGDGSGAGGDGGGGGGGRVVLVTTIHQAKGLEYDFVFIPSMIEGSLPLLPRGLLPNSLEYCEHLEEERRLCYVAFTRARVRLVLSYAEAAEERAGAGPRASSSACSSSGSLQQQQQQQQQQSQSAKPSRFLSAVDAATGAA